MDLLLHPGDDPGRGRPERRGRLSTVGHRQAFRAFARAAKRAGIRFMVIGGTFRDVYGPEYRRQVPAPNNKSSKIASDVVHRWNQIAIDATGLDHTPVAPGENRVFGEQLGPGAAIVVGVLGGLTSFVWLWASRISELQDLRSSI